MVDIGLEMGRSAGRGPIARVQAHHPLTRVPFLLKGIKRYDQGVNFGCFLFHTFCPMSSLFRYLSSTFRCGEVGNNTRHDLSRVLSFLSLLKRRSEDRPRVDSRGWSCLHRLSISKAKTCAKQTTTCSRNRW
jgi:hypothetical protein